METVLIHQRVRSNIRSTIPMGWTIICNIVRKIFFSIKEFKFFVRKQIDNKFFLEIDFMNIILKSMAGTFFGWHTKIIYICFHKYENNIKLVTQG